MGELDLVSTRSVGAYFDGFGYAWLTVFVTWLPVAVAGFVLAGTRVAHAAMRGAGPMRGLARLAIAIEVATLMLSPSFVPLLLGAGWSVDASPLWGLTLLLLIVALSVAGLIAWHRVLVDLSHGSEPRTLA